MPIGFAPIIAEGAPILQPTGGALLAPSPALASGTALQPGSVLLLLPPSFPATTALPGELGSSAQLDVFKSMFRSILPGYSLHTFSAQPLLPALPNPLKYTSVLGNVLAIVKSVPAKGDSLNFVTTVIGYPNTFNTAGIISSITTAPASFTAPTNLPNYTFTGLNAGAAVPALPSGFRHASPVCLI